MFSSQIYASWQETQLDKYTKIFNRVGELLRGRILDIGSGHGDLQQFLKADVLALDIEKPADIVADGSKLPFKNHTFDTVISIDAMHLIKGNDFARVIKPEGFALLALFFNNENYEEKKALLKENLNGFHALMEFELHGRENEYVILARKERMLYSKTTK